MTREEEILKAARNYVSGVTLSSPSDVIHFENGAKWADEHPNLESLWQDAHEEPQNSSELIVYKYKDKYFWFTIKRDINRFYGSWNKFVADEQLIQWAYVSDLFPKGGKK